MRMSEPTRTDFTQLTVSTISISPQSMPLSLPVIR